MPPIAISSDIRYLPLGRRSASTGTRWPIAGEVVELQRHAGRVGNGEQVQDGIGRAAQRDGDGDGVLEGLAREDMGGPDALGQQLHDGRAGATAIRRLGVADRFLGGAVGKAEPERLDRRRHGVGGVHAAAGAGPGNGGALDARELGLGDGAAGVAAHRFEHRDDVGAARARPDGAAVDEHAGSVEPRHGHHAAGHVLVAATDGDEAVEAFARDHRLDGVGDHFARHQRVAHPGRAHGDAVRDTVMVLKITAFPPASLAPGRCERGPVR
jgi:hypothetical protein